MSYRLDLDQALHFVGPDLGPICLQRLYKQTTLVGKELINFDIYVTISTYQDTKQSIINVISFLSGLLIFGCLYKYSCFAV